MQTCGGYSADGCTVVNYTFVVGVYVHVRVCVQVCALIAFNDPCLYVFIVLMLSPR